MFSPILAIVSAIASETVRVPTLADLIFSRSVPTDQRDVRDHLDQALEQVIAGNEIGLRIELDDDPFRAVDRKPDKAFGRDPA